MYELKQRKLFLANIPLNNLRLVFIFFMINLSLTSTSRAFQANIENNPKMPNRDTIASSISKADSVSIGVKDATSETVGKISSESSAQSTALNGGQAKSQSYSISSGEASALKNSIVRVNSDSKSGSIAQTIAGKADSQADSISKVSSQASNNSQSTTNSNSNVKSESSSISTGDNNYLGDPISFDNKKPSDVVRNKEIFHLVEEINSDKSSNQIKTDNYVDWEDIYKQNNFDRYHHKKYTNIKLINIDFDANNRLPSLNLPIQTEGNSNSLSALKFAKINWTYTNFVGLDIAMDSQGNAIALGLDGAVYEYNWTENSWTKIEGDFEMKTGIRLALGWEQSPFVVTSGGDTYYLTCGHKWEKLPGCARDIAVGIGGEVYKVGCERRPGGFRIYKLVCSYDKEKCKPCSRRKNKNKTFSFESDHKKCTWFNINGAGVRIAVHPNGQPFVINDLGAIQFYDRKDWKTIPQTSALDLSISNEGIIIYVGTDYAVYRLYPGKYINDYTKVDYMKLLDRSAISIASGPYAHPMIIGEEYKVYTSSK